MADPAPVPAPAPAINLLLVNSLLSNISFACQNCNSLNVSTSCPKQLKKIKSIVDIDTDVIFLSDIRLSSVENAREVETAFRNANHSMYSLYHNSTKSRRGTGILVKKTLQCVINHTYKDIEENILGLNITLNSVTMNIVSIYGPNTDNTCNDFFDNLNRFLQLYPDCINIVGGDWNATFSTDNSVNNLDIFRMGGPPSNYRSMRIAEICETHSLTDPFRALHPTLREFTFRPRTGRANRSRLDFFLVSDTLCNIINSCSVSPSLSTELFDHKFIKLCINKPEYKQKSSLDNSTMVHTRSKFIIQCATIDCFLQHAIPGPGINIPRGLYEIGQFSNILRCINDIEMQMAVGGRIRIWIFEKQAC